MLGIFYTPSDPIDPTPLTPEEIREEVKIDGTATHIVIASVIMLIGIFALAVAVIDSSVWGYIIGFPLILFSFLLIFLAEDNANTDGEVVRKMGGMWISLMLIVPGFLLLVTWHIVIGSILYLLGFILAFRAHKIYGIVLAIIMAGTHILTLLD
jgi:hypothetical protein